MPFGYHWKPSKAAKMQFAEKMGEVDDFCKANGIGRSISSDSYYFEIGGVYYRVSNHSVEASNKRAHNWKGEQVRREYHPDGREDGVVYIHASKTRIVQIYADLKAGHHLDGFGNRKD